MSHKDYCALADTIIVTLKTVDPYGPSERLKGVWCLVYNLINSLEKAYPRFDRKRFIDHIEQGLNNE